MDNSEPRSICTFCLNSAFLRLIRLSFSPTLPSALHYYLSLCLLHLAQLVSIWIRNLPCRLWLYLRVEYRLFHSVGLLVSFAAVLIRYTYRLAPWLLYLLGDLKQMMLPTYRDCLCTSLGVCGRWRSRTACSPKLFRGITAALVGCRSTYFGRWATSPYSNFLPACANYPGFYLPNLSILIVPCFRKPANLTADRSRTMSSKKIL